MTEVRTRTGFVWDMRIGTPIGYWQKKYRDAIVRDN
jgi:hypothetical protein